MNLLVPNRACGACSVCCTALPVDSPELRKPPGEPCVHVDGRGGCGVYGRRFPVCRDFHCGWRHLPLLDEGWRPDRCGVLILFETDEAAIPAGYPLRPAVKFLVTGPPGAIERIEFLRYLNGLIFHGVPIFLAAPGPRGCFPVRTFLNVALKAAVEASDKTEMIRILRQRWDLLLDGDFEPVRFGRRARAAPSSAA